MTWRVRPVSVLFRGKTAAAVRAGSQTGIVFIILSAACLALLLTAPVDGDFWWSDAPRHALNGVFLRDFVAAHPLHHLVQWAVQYYLKRPALTIMFYPPLFYAVEATAFALFGVSHFIAQCTVSLFVLLLAVSAYLLSRLLLPRWAAAGAALLVIGTPETALWGRQVMLDLPAYGLITASAACLTAYVTTGRPVAIYLAVSFLLAAIYTKYNASFVAPALAAAFVAAKGRAAPRDRHAVIAGLLGAVGLLPAIGLFMRFGAANLTSVSGLRGTLPLDSLACWLFYLEALPAQLGWLTVLLSAGGLVFLVRRIVVAESRWACALLLAWLVAGYLFFTFISLKEARDTLMVLLPLAITAPLFLLAVLPKSLGEPAGLALGMGTLLYTLVFFPVPHMKGYQEVASFLSANVPRDGIVVYSGYRDGNLIFDLTALGNRSDITVIRADKLLLSVPAGERRRGVRQATDDQAAIGRLLRDLGASYFVVQSQFWSDLAVMSRFDTVVTGSEYEKAAHFDLTGDLSTQDGDQGIDILRPTYPVVPKSGRIRFDMPLARQRFEGNIPP